VSTSEQIQSLGQATIVAFILAMFLCFLIMAALMWLGSRVGNRTGSSSPYTPEPLMRGEDLAFSALLSVNDFLDKTCDTDNMPFEISEAAICRQTGRIFSNALNTFKAVSVQWDFLERRHPGHWISWGSLDAVQKEEITRLHDSLEGFQYEQSCTNPRPEKIDTYHSILKPGPLYVDVKTHTLLGWKCVPGTSLEVLIVQKPKTEQGIYI
jgi:hypothetical protein